MHIYRTTEAIRTAANTHPDPELRHLLTLRIQSLEAFDDLPDDLAYLLQVVVLQAAEGAADLEGPMGGHRPGAKELAYPSDKERQTPPCSAVLISMVGLGTSPPVGGLPVCAAQSENQAALLEFLLLMEYGAHTGGSAGREGPRFTSVLCVKLYKPTGQYFQGPQAAGACTGIHHGPVQPSVTGNLAGCGGGFGQWHQD